jgi:hypothetical protein
MNAYYQSDQENNLHQEDKSYQKEATVYTTMRKSHYSSLYCITHLILSFFALYLSWKCSGGKFDVLNFIAALCCPHLYIIWALATRGGCGMFENNSPPMSIGGFNRY